MSSLAPSKLFGTSAYTPGASRPIPDRLAALAPAIPMDAAMTCHQALARLAEYHVWFEEDHPVMRDVVGRRAAAVGFDDPAPVWAELRAAYEGDRRPPETAVIRRAEGVTIYWYARPASYVRDLVLNAVNAGEAARPLRDVLELHEYESQPVAELAQFATGERWGEVIVRDGAPVGVARMLAMAPPAGDEPPADDAVRAGPESGTLPSAVPPSAVPRSVALPAAAAPLPPPAAPLPAAPLPAAPLPAAPPPREVTAYPDVQAPRAVLAGAAFDVEIGLADQPVAGVSGGALSIPVAPDQRTFDVEVRVSADGFDAPDGWSARYTTPVRDVTRGRACVTLVARDPGAPVGVGSLLVHYFVDGVLRGSAARAVAVLRDATVHLPDADPRGLPRTDAPAERALCAPAGGAAGARADIEILIAKPDRDPTSGRFTLALRTPHPVPVPDDLPDIDLGKDPQTFAKLVIDQLLQHDRGPFTEGVVRGLGANVARQLAPAFWAAFGAVARHVRDAERRVPTVLLLAAENLVPWELATLPEPLDPALPPFLCVQTNMGRWILDGGGVPLPPATEVPVTRMAALAGHYPAESGLAPLPHAVEEARELGKRFGAVVRLASEEALSQLLDATLEEDLQRGGAEVVHFAGHGEVDPRTAGAGGLLLDTGRPVHPLLFASTALGERHQPFLFLNACMLGTGGEMLGDASGFPGQCLGGGFRGLVAPLWAVRDTVARQVALDFYDAALGDGRRAPRPLGEVLREIRARYGASVRAKAPVPTYLAYVLYGHPALTLTR